VAQKVKPVPGIMPEDARTIRRIPEDPLLTLPGLPKCPPDFKYTTKLTRERMDLLAIRHSTFLLPEEIKLLEHVVQLNERVLAFEESEKGRFSDEYFSPYIIPVIEHEPWAQKNIPVPPGIRDEVIELIKAKIATGVYEPSQASYRSNWFCVKKKNGKLRIVHDLQILNGITIRDSGLPPAVDAFAEGFAARSIYSMADIFVGYDHRSLHVKSRDLTSFQTPLGLFRLTTLPMGATNAVPEFHSCVVFILQDEIPDVANPFLDDVGVKGPATRYEQPDGSFETLAENPGIRRFVWEHAVDLHRVFHRMGCAGATFSGLKTHIGVPEINIVGHKCTYDGRVPDESKVAVIKNWPIPATVREVRGFLGTCGVVRIWIQGFSEIAAPLVYLTKKNIIFVFTIECIWAMEKLKEALINAPALRPIDYLSELAVILAVDSSYVAVGWILLQLDEEGHRRPSRYGSIAWNERESRYSQPKIELYGLFRAMQKLRPLIVGVKKLIVEVDARYIKGMLNKPDLQPNAAMNRWIFAILLYSFELVHVPGDKHVGPDGLSRRPRAEDDPEEDDCEDWVDHALDSLLTVQVLNTITADSSDLEIKLLEIRNFLKWTTLPDRLNEKGKVQFMKQALHFFYKNGYLWKKSKDLQHRRVVAITECAVLIDKIHTSVGHRGIYGTRKALIDRFWWPSIYKDVTEFVQTCHECQLRTLRKPDVALTVQHPKGIFRKVHMDAMHMTKAGGYQWILAARDDLTGWIEARKVTSLSSKVWSQFIWEEIFCRWGAVTQIVTDNGSDVKKATKVLAERYGVEHILISPYNSRANGKVENGHFPLRESIIKLCQKDVKKWPDVFHAAIWADRITTRKVIGFSPYYLVTGQEPSLPLDIVEAQFLCPLNEKVTTEELLANRARQLLRKDTDVALAEKRLLKSRLSRKEVYDLAHKHTISSPEFAEGSLVLVWNSRIEDELNRKMKPRWLGPMVVVRRTQGGSYILAEIDGTVSKLRYAANRLRKYLQRGGFSMSELAEIELENEE
jgi:hypothetical protein